MLTQGPLFVLGLCYSGNMKYIEVVIHRVSRSLSRTFTYAVDADLHTEQSSLVGHVVAVSFNNGVVGAYVVDQQDTPPQIETILPILGVVAGPYFDEEDVAVARAITEHYACTLVEAISLFVPFSSCPAVLDDGQGGFQLKRPSGLIKYEEFARRASHATVELIPVRAKGQRRVFEMFSDQMLPVSGVRATYPGYRPALNALVEAGLVVIEKRRLYRSASGYEGKQPVHSDAPKQLTTEQSQALNHIQSLTGSKVCLLEGITGSGKTEIYLQAIDQVLAQGRDAIVLVPEIALTPQAVTRFTARFGDIVAVLHSRMSAGEQLDEHDRIRQGQARVIVGPRSALFAVNKRTGIIIIDEEHDGSYKQSSSPRYHARNVALMISQQRNIPVVLGSATPSLSTRKQVSDGTYSAVYLTKRATGASLPVVEIVDLAHEFETGNRTMFSVALTTALQEVRGRGEKAILLLNRRGFANFLLCRECGHVPYCPHCSTSLTFHASHNHLRCHQCNLVVQVPSKCPQCSSSYLRMLGAGTQRVEQELNQIFSGWPVVRMDADTTAAKHGHQQVLDSFEALDSGILLGTQMISKGLDYHDVTLVGVLTADITMNFPDYLAGERTYQLLEQVSGRAGRGDKPGRVIIQSYNPQHPALVAIEARNPELFYRAEEEQRQALGYPPYRNLANVVVSAEDKQRAQSYCNELGEELKAFIRNGSFNQKIEVVGPSVCVFERIANRFRFHLVLRADLDVSLGQVLGELFVKRRLPADIRVVIDVDPESLM